MRYQRACEVLQNGKQKHKWEKNREKGEERKRRILTKQLPALNEFRYNLYKICSPACLSQRRCSVGDELPTHTLAAKCPSCTWGTS